MEMDGVELEGPTPPPPLSVILMDENGDEILDETGEIIESE